MEINKLLIQKMHDEYMIEYEEDLKHGSDYQQMAEDLFLESKNQSASRLIQNARLFQGKCFSLIHVINDLRHVLGLPLIGEDSNSYGYIFNVE